MSVTTEHLEETGVEFEVLPPERTQPPANGDGLRVRTVVLDVRTGHALAVLPADRELDLGRVREALDSRHVELASAEEVAADYPEFPADAVPPLGDWMHTPMVLDTQVTDHELLVFDDGEQSVRVAGRDLFGTAQIRVADICAG